METLSHPYDLRDPEPPSKGGFWATRGDLWVTATTRYPKAATRGLPGRRAGRVVGSWAGAATHNSAASAGDALRAAIDDEFAECAHLVFEFGLVASVALEQRR